MKAILSRMLRLKPRDTVYGLTALSARKELLDVRRRHSELLDQRRQLPHSDEVGRRWINEQIEQNLARIDDIERRYFG